MTKATLQVAILPWESESGHITCPIYKETEVFQDEILNFWCWECQGKTSHLTTFWQLIQLSVAATCLCNSYWPALLWPGSRCSPQHEQTMTMPCLKHWCTRLWSPCFSATSQESFLTLAGGLNIWKGLAQSQHVTTSSVGWGCPMLPGMSGLAWVWLSVGAHQAEAQPGLPFTRHWTVLFPPPGQSNAISPSALD